MQKGSKVLAVLQHRYLLLGITLLVPVLLGIQSYFNSVNYEGPNCRQYSNYQVFKYAHLHLLGDHDLYGDHLTEHCFTFKYSPGFALFFGVFAYLPDWLGLVLWMLLSGVMSYVAIRALPGWGPGRQILLLVFIVFEWQVSIQGQQTNALIAMALLLAYALLERGRALPATLLIVLTAFIKVFGLAAMVLYIFYPGKLRLAAYSLGWCLLFAALPLVVVGPSDLLAIYQDWLAQMAGDMDFKGMSLYGLLETTTGWSPPRTALALGSLGLMLGSLGRVGCWSSAWYRQALLAALLIWAVVFNHKAESHTYVIAMVGIGLWFFSVERRPWWDLALLIFAFLGVSVLFSDFVPRPWKHGFGMAYHIKALPATLLWLRVVADLWLRKPAQSAPVAAATIG